MGVLMRKVMAMIEVLMRKVSDNDGGVDAKC